MTNQHGCKPDFPLHGTHLRAGIEAWGELADGRRVEEWRVGLRCTSGRCCGCESLSILHDPARGRRVGCTGHGTRRKGRRARRLRGKSWLLARSRLDARGREGGGVDIERLFRPDNDWVSHFPQIVKQLHRPRPAAPRGRHTKPSRQPLQRGDAVRNDQCSAQRPHTLVRRARATARSCLMFQRPPATPSAYISCWFPLLFLFKSCEKVQPWSS